jgi:hypothetical protein
MLHPRSAPLATDDAVAVADHRLCRWYQRSVQLSAAANSMPDFVRGWRAPA